MIGNTNGIVSSFIHQQVAEERIVKVNLFALTDIAAVHSFLL